MPEEVPFRVVHEDDDLAVVDKPAGVVVHPGAGWKEGTLVSGLMSRYPSIEGVGQSDRWGIVHRLDRDTSGLMAVALSALGYEGLTRQVRSHTMRREYLALVDKPFSVPTGTIDAPIAPDPARPGRRRVSPEGRPARTHYEVVKEFPTQDVTLIRLRLETGRTHQIRVHMAAIDHPLVGDRLYRGGPDRIEAPRLFLHATTLGLDHPVSGEPLRFESDLAPELARVIAGLEE
jgi:23S rRNA pseudouridine1911/1915/1917 synthase